MGWMLSGALVLSFVMVDVVWTTLTTQGSGPLTTCITDASRRLSNGLHRLSGGRAFMLPTAPLTIVTLGVLWLAALWIGWFLLFSAFPSGLVSGQTGRAADTVERIYYVGFTLSTLGVGDYKPTSDITRLFTVFASFNGLVIVTLVITYAIPLVQGAVHRRKLAFTISLLGKTPLDIVKRATDTDNTRGFEGILQTVTNDLIQSSEQRLAYPVLDLFYCRHRRYSLGLQVAKLDEALSLVAFGFKPGARLQSNAISDLQEVIKQYLYRVESRAGKLDSEVPPVEPSPQYSDGYQLPLLSAKELEETFKCLRNRRMHLLQLVHSEGWNWNDVEGRALDDKMR
ncbi:potassium channel family protein [uncultured Marinobacter sp.]|uniref:potassium channel family protein n=1 Tax=uncultured Marinobacter sp. TaxID=187379 RepID=UPI002624CC30|nr:potassium channel family protein [uncultured Marinobacter sp.]